MLLIRLLHILAALCVLFVTGCSVHSVDEETVLPDVAIPARFAEASEGNAVTLSWDRSWWESFGDDDLSHMIEVGLTANFTVQQFVARIEQAMALANQAGARLYPSLSGTAGYEYEWDGKQAATETRDRQDSGDFGVLLRWELDIWKRLSSARRAEQFEYQATLEDWLGARLLISSAIAETYFEIKEQRRQLEVIRAQIEINQTLQQLTSLRFGQGQSSIVDVLQQQEQLEETLARVPETEARIGQLQYALDVLLGRPPGAEPVVLTSSLERPPPLPEVGIPSQLLVRRPDLRGVQKRILALDYDVGVALADQLPNLSLSGSLDWRGDPSFGDEITSLFARLAGPIFDAGERRNEVRFREARLREALAGYSENYLSALFEVESALLVERKEQERLILVEQQLATSRRLLNESQNRFSQGLTDYLPVFTSLTIVQNLERDVVSARRAVLSARVALHRALGGPIVSVESPVVLSQSHD